MSYVFPGGVAGRGQAEPTVSVIAACGPGAGRDSPASLASAEPRLL